VLIATGAIEPPDPFLGLEAAGVVRRTGPEAKNLRVGDRVMVFGRWTFSSFVMESELLYAKLPDELSFNDGATMACVYCASIYSLIDVGNLKAGQVNGRPLLVLGYRTNCCQSILIHSGCGGIGIAAIQVARMIGADIYTTVGNDEKVKYLMNTFNLPRNRIFNSRDTSFVDGVIRETNGRGVDLVLNSLSGELLHATWRCVAEFGKMVEIGKKDLMGAGKLDMDVFLLNRSYCCVDIDRIRSERPAIIARYGLRDPRC
jgi:NADPH:quinone reductase-like Zn-dependent oxidoreductase